MLKLYTVSERLGDREASELRALLEREWGAFPPFETQASGKKTPSPIVAVENGLLMGGLVFSLWSKTEQEPVSVWVNGVIVKPEFRRQGVASKLIQQATKNERPLWALTDLPDLYLNLGWVVASHSDNGTVLQHGA